MFNINCDQLEKTKQSNNNTGNATKKSNTFKLDIKLPQFSYSTSKSPEIRLNEAETNGNRFDNLYDAIKYIKCHCMFHFGKFNQRLAQHYLRSCFIYDPYVNSYIGQTSVDKREFQQTFKRVCQ